MKINYIYIMLIICLMTSCKKNTTPVFDDLDSRVGTAVKLDQAMLITPEYGWKATIYPKGGKGYLMYFKFTADGKVTMLSDFNNTTATVPAESTYRLKALQRPTLIFDSYNYIHMLADPDGTVNGGPTGTGLKSDFEFAITSTTSGDSLKIEGVVNGNIMTMVKLTAADAAKILAGNIKTRMDENAAYVNANRYPYLQFEDGLKATVTIDPATKSVKFSYLDDKNVAVNATVTYATSLTGLNLSDALTYKNASFNELLWDATAKVYYVNVGGKRINVQNGTFPLIPFDSLLGFGKDYKTIEYNPLTLSGGLGSEFDAFYKTTAANFRALSTSKRELNYMRLTFSADNVVQLRFSYTTTQEYLADVTYTMAKDANGVIKFVFVTWNGNASGTNGPAVIKVRDYFESNSFKAQWVANTISGSTVLLGGLYTVSGSPSFFYGVAGK